MNFLRAAHRTKGFAFLVSCLACFLRLRRLSGFDTSSIYPDLLHVMWLGVGRDFVGSALLDLATHWPVLQYLETFNERLSHIRQDFADFCIRNKLRPSTVEEISFLACIVSKNSQLIIFHFGNPSAKSKVCRNWAWKR